MGSKDIVLLSSSIRHSLYSDQFFIVWHSRSPATKSYVFRPICYTICYFRDYIWDLFTTYLSYYYFTISLSYWPIVLHPLSSCVYELPSIIPTLLSTSTFLLLHYLPRLHFIYYILFSLFSVTSQRLFACFTIGILIL